MRRRAIVPTAFVLLAACWHATVETGLTPSTVVIDKAWASSWIYGLVPPKTVETASRCPDGVAKVETELTFLNQVVHILTLGIYTPNADPGHLRASERDERGGDGCYPHRTGKVRGEGCAISLQAGSGSGIPAKRSGAGALRPG